MRAMTLEEMKAVELEIMDEIDAICRQHGLTYFLGYGSVLGAVRHGGFIPWDDDMDVIMPRDDYEQLIAHFDKWRTSKNYALTFCRNDTSVYQFVKIIDTRTSVKERYVSASYKTGVWVDIFPLDGIPKDAKRVFRRNARLTASLALALSDPSNGTTPLRKLAKKLLDPIAKRMDPAHYSRLIDDNAHHCEKTDEAAYLDIVSMADPDIVQPSSWFEPNEVDFENRRYFIPRSYDEYLTLNYGDWRTPLPESQRHSHTTEAYWIDRD